MFTKGNIQNVSSDASGNKHGENETDRENYRDKLGNENVKPQNISNWKHIIFSIITAFVESIESKVSRWVKGLKTLQKNWERVGNFTKWYVKKDIPEKINKKKKKLIPHFPKLKV